MNNRDLQGLRYRLYARKSTDTEDKQVQSLDDQIKVMQSTAKREGARLIGEPLRESKSAKRPDARPIFEEMLNEVED